MKILYIISAVLVILFLMTQLYALKSQKNIDQYSYTIIQKYKDFEVRSYEAALFTSVQIPSEGFKKSSSTGFRILAGYIFGGNDRQEKIAMTSPVSMSLEDTTTMMFMVPKNLKKEALPKPNSSGIQIKEEPTKIMAAIEFGGWADDEKIEAYKLKLMAALDAEGILYTDRFFFYGYNAPYEMLNRRNEVVVELLPH